MLHTITNANLERIMFEASQVQAELDRFNGLLESKFGHGKIYIVQGPPCQFDYVFHEGDSSITRCVDAKIVHFDLLIQMSYFNAVKHLMQLSML